MNSTQIIVAVLIAIGANGVTDSLACAAPVSFPGPIKEVTSPDGRAKVDYIDPGENADGLHLYQLRLLKDGRADKLDEFTRRVELAWSPSADRLFETNFIGSNVADCLVVTLTRSHPVVRSVTDAIQRAALPGISQDLRGDHVYVGCDRWRSRRTLDIHMEGRSFRRGFKHRLTYDAVTDRVSIASPRPKA